MRKTQETRKCSKKYLVPPLHKEAARHTIIISTKGAKFSLALGGFHFILTHMVPREDPMAKTMGRSRESFVTANLRSLKLNCDLIEPCSFFNWGHTSATQESFLAQNLRMILCSIQGIMCQELKARLQDAKHELQPLSSLSCLLTVLLIEIFTITLGGFLDSFTLG